MSSSFSAFGLAAEARIKSTCESGGSVAATCRQAAQSAPDAQTESELSAIKDSERLDRMADAI